MLTRSLMSGDSRHDPGTGVPGITRVGWTADGKTGPWAAHLEAADAIVNLSGDALDRGRWTPQRKARLRDGRILATRSLAAAILSAAKPPAVFVSGSGVDYYASSNSGPSTESSSPGTGFLAHLCKDWEAEADRAESPGTRVVLLRTGIALERSGGALPRMMLPFRFFVGGKIGSGQQYFSWIHRLDWVEMVRWIVLTPEAKGPINAMAPEPVTNRELSRALGHALHRPSLRARPWRRVADRPRGTCRAAARRPARDPGASTGAWLSLPVSGYLPGVQGNLRGVEAVSFGLKNLTGGREEGGLGNW